MKKIICTFLPLVYVIALVGCSGNSSSNPPIAKSSRNITESPSIPKESDKQEKRMHNQNATLYRL
jgi:hypothetical protein